MKPILFSTPMVQAILDGRKTQTRRIVKFPHDYSVHRYDGIENGKHMFAWGLMLDGMCFDGGFQFEAPYSVGDVLWVRETWCNISDWTCVDPSVGLPDGFIYKADWHARLEHPRWRPSIHMPREAARLFLRVTGVRAERVQDISTSDCEEEGITSDIERFNGHMIPHHDWIVGEFSKLWDSCNAKRGYGWDTNPWVWVITFERTTV